MVSLFVVLESDIHVEGPSLERDYDASPKLHKPPATVHSAIKRRVRMGEVGARSILRETLKATLLYPNDYSLTDNTLVEIPREAVRIGNPSWLSAFIYALNDESIGVTGESVQEWKIGTIRG